MPSENVDIDQISLLEAILPLGLKLRTANSLDAINDDLDTLRANLTSEMVLQLCGSAIDQFLATHSPSIAYYICLVLIAASRRFFDNHTEAIAAMSAGSVLMQSGHVEASWPYLQFACDVFENEGDSSLHMVALQRLGSSYLNTDDPTKGLPALERCLAMARETGDTSLEAAALNNIGSVYLITDKNDKALNSYNDALAAAQKANDERTVRDCLGNLTNVLLQLNRYTEAKSAVSQAIEIDRKWADDLGLAKDLIILSRVEKQLLDFNEAKDHLSLALDLAEDFETHETEQICYQELMTLYKMTDNLQQAIRCGREAARIAHERGLIEEEKAILAQLARWYPMS